MDIPAIEGWQNLPVKRNLCDLVHDKKANKNSVACLLYPNS